MSDRIDLPRVSADVLSEFLEVALHSLLYIRGLYPAGVFNRRKKYNIPAQICMHPDVYSYVQEVVTGIRPLLEENAAEKVIFVILTKDLIIVERFVFEIAASSTSDTAVTEYVSDPYLYHLEESFRAFLLKISLTEALLQPLPAECTWAVHVHTKESSVANMHDRARITEFPWLQVDPNEINLLNPSILPLKASNSKLVKMQLYVEEAEHKM